MRFFVFMLAVLAFSAPVYADTPPVCSISENLSRNSRGAAVESLQTFLAEQGAFLVSVSGFFGPVTEQALAQFQVNNAIVARLADGGVFGPKTRNVVQTKWCGGKTTVMPTVTRLAHSCSTVTVPDCGGGELVTEYDSYGCLSHWKCTTKKVFKAPTIARFSGPTNLTVGTMGTWDAQVNAPIGDVLSYQVNWGEATSSPAVYPPPFFHSYARPGTYTLTLTVENGSGAHTSMTSMVVVSSTTPVVATSTTAIPVVTPSSTITTPPQGWGSRCPTPWGGAVAYDGATVPYEPYFTGGSEPGMTAARMKCANGVWLRCDSYGMNCAAS